MNRRTLVVSLAAVCLAGCESKDMTGVPLSQYESDATEALVRALLKSLPDPNPGVPKSYAIAVGEIVPGRDFTAATVPFIKRFDDLKRRVVSAEVLTTTEPGHLIIDPDLRVPAFVLQIRLMRQTSASTWEYDAAWSYKQFFQRSKWRVEQIVQQAGRGWESYLVEQVGITEGNWPPDPPK